MEDEELDVMLLVGEAVQRHEQELKEARREVFAMLIEDAWRTAMRSRHYLTSQCLDTPSESAWMVLFEYGSDLNFLNATSLTRIAFRQLLHRFAACYTIRDPNSRGRPPKLQYLHQVLGLMLVFYTGSMEQSSLSMLFGVPPSTLSPTLQRAERVLNQALNDYKPSRIAWPSPAHQAKLAKLVEAREPMLKHTFGFIDDKNLRVQQPSNADMQNAMYNGWLHTVFVTGTICFAADGCIVWSKHNCRGSWNDSDTSLEFRSKLLDPVMCPDPRMNVVSDLAFPCSATRAGRILTPLKDGDLDRIEPSLRSSARTLSMMRSRLYVKLLSGAWAVYKRCTAASTCRFLTTLNCVG
ncbi:hypothetical protein F443_07091 [Phytophthora nicotianae P1569]|uniref:DDE Tnp4 domain-containing protein n=2 Tax=Phytophthora nicotianae TaxID=4792 RepID=V9FCW7_PHYNI|nr:hypothetical protein F443_07091 [Phytophthora nicotianae P1569]